MKMVGQIHNKTMSTDSTKKRKQIKSKCVLDEEALGKKQKQRGENKITKTENG